MSRERPRWTSRTDRTRERPQTIPHHQTLVLSERGRAVLFETLAHPPELSPRLRRAFAAARLRVERRISPVVPLGSPRGAPAELAEAAA